VIKVFTCRRSSVLLISLFYVPAVIASLAAGLLTGWGGTFLAISISAGSATSVIGFVIFGMAWEWNGAGNNLAQDTEQELTKLLAEIYEGI
jgi:Zn-dependent alcohol dehydrogenase